MNMGQRCVQLASTYTGSTSDNTGILHVQQLPPNPAIIAPGPALFFVVVNGVPSVGLQIMIGNGQLGDQQTQEIEECFQRYHAIRFSKYAQLRDEGLIDHLLIDQNKKNNKRKHLGTQTDQPLKKFRTYESLVDFPDTNGCTIF